MFTCEPDESRCETDFTFAYEANVDSSDVVTDETSRWWPFCFATKTKQIIAYLHHIISATPCPLKASSSHRNDSCKPAYNFSKSWDFKLQVRGGARIPMHIVPEVGSEKHAPSHSGMRPVHTKGLFEMK